MSDHFFLNVNILGVGNEGKTSVTPSLKNFLGPKKKLILKILKRKIYPPKKN